MNTEELKKHIGYTFQNEDYLKEALTHRSYLNENPKWGVPHNERLEFLGDAVLELVVTEELFNRYADQAEGWMTSVRAALVNYVMLAQVAREAGMEGTILMSRGEQRDTGRARDVILANAIESLIGALYQDGGYPAAKKFINEFVLAHLAEIIKKGLYIDAKSQLQERVQAQLKVTPSYRVIEENGPDHAKVFKVGVYFGDKLIATGSGNAKQDGEVEAARRALEIVDNERKPLL
ncbi:MAG: ribonuclease III [Candidatus Harrisonbacteria bacterium CG10_big_fil_rev_8_21_14_0_10_49_15]|uniref:Ribonuclease 3 n=1 Tax=Candidatus Harrisonbacteria bacterium CG10_big_fil_rev_8_21_14_0_10_49_15 TaxID=1974587 RepID=A0A2H0UN23_9BACT|nr:MAG: ribonuclease III [Candidatus Harrisonbacteria bacterium CG10_big_fil_rev_8_21_14_0_10_49_15]